MKKCIKLYDKDGQLLGFQEYTQGGGGEPTLPYSTTPAFPITTTSGGSFVVTKRDGSIFTTEEVEHLKFIIDGKMVYPTIGSGIEWQSGYQTVLTVARPSGTMWPSSINVTMPKDGYTVSAIY